MRIVHVVPSYLPAVRHGGPIFAIHGLCRALAARGHQVEVFTTNVDGPNNSPVPLGTGVELDGVQIRYFPSYILRRLYWSPPLARALRASVTNCSVMHLHSVFLWPTWAAAGIARTAHIPYVISPRGMLVKDLIKRKSRLIKMAWIELVEKTNLKGASAIHVTSLIEATEIRRFGWSLPHISMVPNGVEDIEAYDRDRVSADVREIGADQPLILSLGRISWKKGLDRLLRAIARTDVGKLAIVGPDDEKLTPQLEQLACELKLTDRVRFLPRTVLGADKEYLFRSAKVFVLPSYSENFANTILEAMQRGVPVVLTPEVGAAEIVQECGGGLVVSGDPEPLGTAISRLIADPSFARAMGAAGQKHILEHYTWNQMAARMEGLYEMVQRGN